MLQPGFESGRKTANLDLVSSFVYGRLSEHVKHIGLHHVLLPIKTFQHHHR